MADFNGQIYTEIQPFASISSNLANMSYNWRANYLKSASTNLRYQISWNGLNENQEPSKANFSSGSGDVINIIFRVYATTQFPYPVATSDWDLVGEIRKSRDIANRNYSNNLIDATGQRFTVDISKLCQDLLSYSLVPIKKGTWQSSEWGGMNGGVSKNDNVTTTISNYNVTPNGTYRHIKVTAIPEVILANGTIEESASGLVSFNTIAVINSVAQYEKNDIYYNTRYIIQKSLANANFPRGFLSFCPNYTQTTVSPFLKQVREDEEAEWLYWWQRNMGIGASTGIPNQQTTTARLKCISYLANGTAQNTFYLSDFNSNLDKETVSNLSVFKLRQERMCVQNVSPVYINANAQDDAGNSLTGQIDSSTSYYKASLENINAEDNLVTNGDFANPSDWTFSGGGIQILNGKLNFTSTTREASQSISIVNGKTYKVNYEISNYTTGDVRVELGSSNGISRNANGIYTEYIVSTGTSSVYIDAVTVFTGSIDNISVQENPVTIRTTEFRYFKIDRETANIPYGFVRFHWLNRLGAVDSYTAKRNVVESLSVSKSTIETNSADRTWYQDDQLAGGAAVDPANYISNTMRGGNIYKGGREVLGVNAERLNSVFTEPLNKQTADWLEEIVTSPNVWIEMDTDATKRGNTVNPFQRPSTKEYIPVIITNSEVQTLNQEEGLVKFNIEYTLSHKVQTQSN